MQKLSRRHLLTAATSGLLLTGLPQDSFAAEKKQQKFASRSWYMKSANNRTETFKVISPIFEDENIDVASIIPEAGTKRTPYYDPRKNQLLEIANERVRSIKLLNTHTGERAKVAFWDSGRYLADGLDEANHLLRDHRTNETIEMDPRLLDMVFALQKRMESSETIHVVSGYRSPRTNETLRSRSGGVSKTSFHLTGQAMDLFVPGFKLNNLRQNALAMAVGGVGYYPESGFVHIDTGAPRAWIGA